MDAANAMNVGQPSNDASKTPLGTSRIVLSSPYIVGVIANSTNRTERPTTIDTIAATAVPLRHTNPRMNGTTRQANSALRETRQQGGVAATACLGALTH